MGKLLKRVALDFSHPIDTTWHGYLNPHYKATPCPHCEDGYSPEYTRMKAQWYSHRGGDFRPEMRGSKPIIPDDPYVVAVITEKCKRSADHFGTSAGNVHREAVRMCEIWNTSWGHHLNDADVKALIDGGRLMDFTHTWNQGDGWKPKEPAYLPTADEVNRWSLSGMGHDSINCWIVLKAECERLRVPHACQHCEGTGEVWDNPEYKKTHDEWKEYEPPTGEGYQLWENTTEGSPQSPVFTTIEDLCKWCETGATTFAYNRATAAEWRKMLDGDFVCHQEGNILFI